MLSERFTAARALQWCWSWNKAADSHHAKDSTRSQKCFPWDKISDLLPLSRNWGHVNLNMLPLLAENRPSQTDYVLLKRAPGRIKVEEEKPTAGTKQLNFFSTPPFRLGDTYVSLSLLESRESHVIVAPPFHALWVQGLIPLSKGNEQLLTFKLT